MTRAKGSIDIAAPPDVAWDWIVDPDKYLVWNTDFSEYTTIDHKEGKAGTTYYMVGIKAEGTFTIEATEEGCTVSFGEDLELPGAKGRIIGALFLKKAKTSNIEESLQNLKKAVETNLPA